MRVFISDAVLRAEFTAVLKVLAESNIRTNIFKVPHCRLHNARPLLDGHRGFSNCMAMSSVEPILRDNVQEKNGVHLHHNGYARLLQSCIEGKTVLEGKRVHACMLKTGVEWDLFLGNTLANMYSKCGSMLDARHVFDKMPKRNSVSWNSMIAGYAQSDRGADAWQFYCQMRFAGVRPDQFTFGSVLRACACGLALDDGKQVHVLIIKMGFESDVFVGSALVDMYAKCTALENAHQVFREMPERNVVSWNAMIAGTAQNGHCEDALNLFYQMRQEGMMPSQFTFASVLSACASHETLEHGKGVHAHIIQTGLDSDVFVGSSLVDMYAKCGSIEDAQNVFNEMPKRNAVSWTAMISGYARHDRVKDALQLFEEMLYAGMNLNPFTLTSVLSACASPEAIEEGKQVHARIVETGFEKDVSVGNSLVNMYAKCGSTYDARQVFNKMCERDVVSWTAMLAGYAQNMQEEDAIELFCTLQREGMKPEKFTFSTVLTACACLASVEHGKQVHTLSIKTAFESDVSVGSALFTMYSKCGNIEDARIVFDKMPERDLVSWTAMIAGYAQHGWGKDALQIFEQMQQAAIKPDKFTFASVLVACSTPEGLKQGKEVHAQIVKRGFDLDAHVGSVLVSMYSKCGNIGSAHKVFESMPERDLVLWSAMIAGYAQNGHSEDALKHFCQMQMADMDMDNFIFSSALVACATLAYLEQGKQVHACIVKTGFRSDVSAGSALITMYSKCGSIEDACKAFNILHKRDVISWTAMIAGCAQHGHGKEALQLFEQMQEAGLTPDHVSFVGVLSACSHIGLVNEGCHYFDSMIQDYGITPRLEHYICIVDLLGRAGYLHEAESFINEMPFDPGALVWGTLLGACRVHGNMELGKHVADHLLELEPDNSATYVLLSNIYADAGMWDDVARVRTMMKDKGVNKEPGCSWIQIKTGVHTFVAQDRSHPQVEEVYAKLEELAGHMEGAGFASHTDIAFHDVQQQKQCHLYFHSEMLALAFGLINTLPGTPIRIIKNLRVCHNCHTATKFISKIAGREIIMRDANRFHHFKDRTCSCGDYW